VGHVRAPFAGVRASFLASAAAVAALAFSSVGAAADDPNDPDPGFQFPASSASFGGASPLATSRTVQHWMGQTKNPTDGVTYRYNMVGADPATNGTATVGVDIIPLDVNVAGRSFSGSSIAPAVLASPLFQTGDYTSTVAATNSHGARGAGGALSAGNTGVQLLDSTMRSEFDKVGTAYHLTFDTPAVQDPVTIDVPADLGTTLTSPGHVTYADVDVKWFQTRIQNEMHRLHLDPTRLALFLTYDVVLFTGNSPMNCCVIGAHGAGTATGATNGSAHGNGNQPVQTFAWASWLTAGFFSRRTAWAKQDLHSLSHELAEWANNPFADNTVQPWFSPLAPQYGCSGELETGDPVVGVGWAQGTNPYDQNPFSDGTYHPEDEVFLPWFMRSTPATQGSQHDATSGRFTFMGDLNPSGIFHLASTGC